MLRRNLVHAVRYPVILYLIATPVIFLLLFVYVFGSTLGAGIGGAGHGRPTSSTSCPGVLLLTIAGGVSGPAISVSKDLTEGIIARFRTMDISRSAVLTGHVLGNLLQVLLAVAVVTGVALLMGFRAPASVWGWLGAAGLLAAIGYVAVLAGRGVRRLRQGRREREQPADAAADPPVPRQRLRADRVDARVAAVVRRVPAVHPVHRDAARAAVRHRPGQQRLAQPRLDRRDRPDRLALGARTSTSARPSAPRSGRWAGR